MSRPALRTLILTAMIPAVALAAAKIADFDVVCPLFGHQFKAQSLVKDEPTNTFDSDFCKRARGDSPYLLAVWTCPYCFFSAYQADFRGSLDASFRDMELRSYPVEAGTVEQADLFVATKYFNAETYYRKAGRDARFLADLTLRGSWGCRVYDLEEPPEIETLRRKLDDELPDGRNIRNVELFHRKLEEHIARKIESGGLTEAQSQIYRYLRAESLRQAGERLAAQAIFDELVEERLLADRYLGNAQRRSVLCVKEGEFQEKALAYLAEAAEQGLIPEPERPRITYLRGELSRRLGRYEEARALYAAAGEMEDLEPALRELIDGQTKRLPSPTAGEEDGR